MLLKTKIKILVLLLALYCSKITLAQKDSVVRKLSYEYTYFSIDTLYFHSKKIEIQHTLIRNRELCRKISNLDDFVFNDSVNKTSLLHIANRHTTITIATIPIDDIIIDDSKELILCLSRAIISPYQIVLYNFDGKLLFKKIISPFEIVLDSINYVQFCDSFPAFLQYAINEKQILFEKGLYYIDLGYWKFLSKEEKEKIQSKKWYKQSHYFPNLFPEYINSNSSARLSKYTNFYSLTDPFYEFEMYQPSQPIGIILNDEFGGKVTIPLSFCSFSGRPE